MKKWNGYDWLLFVYVTLSILWLIVAGIKIILMFKGG